MAESKIYIYVHLIWSTKDRLQFLSKPLRKVLFAQMKQNAEAKGINVVVVNGMEDHVHCLVKLMAVQNVLDTVKYIKAFSVNWVNDSKFLKEQFDWEDEYAAYSVSPTNINKVTDYIEKQDEYHTAKNFEEEMAMISQLNLTRS
ncbi:MAG: transposase [Chitinophagaceae bacterium]|nr:transposase [Chitinophagaceae bacterium]